MLNNIKKVVFLYNLKRGTEPYEADFDEQCTIDAIIESISSQFICIPIEATKDMLWIEKISQEKPDIVFNVTEWFAWWAREAWIPTILDQLWITYTWPRPKEIVISHDKYLTKKILENDVVTPKSLLIKHTSLNQWYWKLGENLSFPLICKLNSEWSSMWMNANCIVYNVEELQNQISYLQKNFLSDIIVEEYIDWRDISISFIDWVWISESIEYVYPNKTIYDYELKTSKNSSVTVKIANNIGPALQKKIEQISQKIVEKMWVKWYCRIDYRLDSNEEVYFLEVNAQVSFHPDGAFYWWAKTRNLSFNDLILHVIYHSQRELFTNS